MSWLTGWHQAEATRKLLNLFLGFPSRVLPSLWNTDILVEPVHPFNISSHLRPPCRAATHFPSETLFSFSCWLPAWHLSKTQGWQKNILSSSPENLVAFESQAAEHPFCSQRIAGDWDSRWKNDMFSDSPKKSVSRLGWVGSTEPFQSHMKLYFVSVLAHKGYCPASKERAITHIWGAAVSKERWDTPSSSLTRCSHCQPSPHPPNTLPVLSSSVTTGRNRASASVDSLL